MHNDCKDHDEAGFNMHKNITSKVPTESWRFQQRLKFFCDICRKQCRDANGFKCHCISTHHQRMIQLISENPKYYIDQYSSEFEKQFLDYLNRKYANTLVDSSKVYNEYLQLKQHININATKWPTFLDFLYYAQDKEHIKIQINEKGYFIASNQNTENVISKPTESKDEIKNKEKKREEKRLQKLIKHASQIEKAQKKNTLINSKQHECIEDANEKKDQESKYINNVNLENVDYKGEITIQSNFNFNKNNDNNEIIALNAIFKEIDENKTNSKILPNQDENQIMKKLDEAINLIGEPKSAKKNDEKEISWIIPGIIVKIIDKSIEKYFSKKAKIMKVEEDYLAEVKIEGSKDILKIDQAMLETVIPKIEGKVMVLIGPDKGNKGILKSIDFEDYEALIELEDGNQINLPYEFFSKFAE